MLYPMENILHFQFITKTKATYGVNLRRNGKGSLMRYTGGWGGIRTHEALSRLPVFKTGAFNRSATHPCLHQVIEICMMSQGSCLASLRNKLYDPSK